MVGHGMQELEGVGNISRSAAKSLNSDSRKLYFTGLRAQSQVKTTMTWQHSSPVYLEVVWPHEEVSNTLPHDPHDPLIKVLGLASCSGIFHLGIYQTCQTVDLQQTLLVSCNSAVKDGHTVLSWPLAAASNYTYVQVLQQAHKYHVSQAACSSC